MYACSVVDPVLELLLDHHHRSSSEKADEDLGKISELGTQWKEIAMTLSGVLEGKQFICGDRYSNLAHSCLIEFSYVEIYHLHTPIDTYYTVSKGIKQQCKNVTFVKLYLTYIFVICFILEMIIRTLFEHCADCMKNWRVLDVYISMPKYYVCRNL